MKTPYNILKIPWVRIAALMAMMAVTVTVHYHGMSQEDPILRGVFRQFCYIPIVLAALWFGLRGGLLAAGVIVAAVGPHLMMMHGIAGGEAAQEGLEYAYYFLFGGLFGYLSDRERTAQRKREELALQVGRMEHLSALGELAAGLAHEIKNPLGAIQGAAEIIAPEVPAGHPKQEFVGILLEEVSRLNRVVEDFLAYARPVNLNWARFAVGPVLDQVLAQIKLREDAAGIELSSDFPFDLIVRGDAEKLKQVFLNLGLNAAEAMKGKGRLRIRAGRAKDEVRIEFHDQGPGVPEAERRRIFMPFVTGKDRGAGLGLTISERIVLAHGGRLEVEDSEDGGALFRVVLPEGAG